jgi:signal transduction histidine kinase
MNWFRDAQLGVKLNLVIVVAVAALAATILTLLARSTNALIDEVGQQRIRQEVAVLTNNLTQTQDELVTAGSLLSNTPGLVNAVAEGNANVVRSLSLSAVPSLKLTDFRVFNADGEYLTNLDAEETQGGEDLEAGLISQALLGIQRITLFNDGVHLEFVLIRPLRDDSATIVGGLLLARELDGEFLSALNFERQGVELSLIYQGQVVATGSADSEDGAAPTADFQAGLLSMANTGEVAINPAIIYSSDGVPRAEAYIPVQGLDDRNPAAALNIRVDNGAIAAYERSLIGSFSAVLAAVAVAVVVAVMLMLRVTVTSRLTTLQQAAQLVAQGEYDRQLHVAGQDELGQVAHSFNLMAEAIQQREASLNELNQSLEQRVAERTVELKEARDEALAAQRIANENSRLKSEFLATMSHELRTPLNAIEGFTSIMLSGMGVELSPRAEDMVKRVAANSRRLLHLINDFLDLSRIEAGRLELVKSPVSPAALAQKWEREVGVLGEGKGIAFGVNIDPELPETLLSDEDALSKITINLLSNAFKFTHEGQVSLDLQRADGHWMISVTDTGIGIPPHAREYIFDEFRQVDSSSKRLYGGTGLGLSLVQKLSRAMGGSVAVRSEVGEGSTFTVTLPLEEVEEQMQGAIA